MRNHYSLLLFFKSFWKLDVWIYNHSIMWETNIEVTELNILIFTNSHPYPRVITNTICKILLMLYKEKNTKRKISVFWHGTFPLLQSSMKNLKEEKPLISSFCQPKC